LSVQNFAIGDADEARRQADPARRATVALKANSSRPITRALQLVTVYHACASTSFRICKQRHIRVTSDEHSPANKANPRMNNPNFRMIRRKAMKTIVSALVALSVLAGIAGPVAAADAKTFFEQQDRAHY
jgi:hypothetical protein